MIVRFGARPVENLGRAQKKKPDLLDAWASGRFGLRHSVMLISIARRIGRRSQPTTPECHRSTVGARSVARPCPTAGVGISRGKHAQQSRPSTRATGAGTTTNAGHSPRPFKPVMQRCVFLGIRLVHQTKLPRGETRPNVKVYAPPLPWAKRNTNSP